MTPHLFFNFHILFDDPPIYRVDWIKLKCFFFFDPDGSDLTQTNANEQMTTTAATNYWTQTPQTVLPCDDDEYDAACDEVAALTMEWSQHRFGLCCECECGLDDEADFVITGNANQDDTSLICSACFTTLTEGPTYAS